jgi:serine/threonine protein phosphatase PrpC
VNDTKKNGHAPTRLSRGNDANPWRVNEVLGLPGQPPGGREKNEDRMGYCYTRDAGLFVLADGMGGHPEGEVAAQMALQTISALFQREAKPTLADPLRFLHDA